MSGQSFEMRAQGQDAAELIALGLQSIVSLGTNLARVRSVNHDSWPSSVVTRMCGEVQL